MNAETEWLECPIDLSQVPSAVDIILAQAKEELPRDWEDMLYEESRELRALGVAKEAAKEGDYPDGTIFVEGVPILPPASGRLDRWRIDSEDLVYQEGRDRLEGDCAGVGA